MPIFTKDSLPKAIGALLKLNNYEVKYSVKVAGGEVDIVARSISDPLASEIYIEATIEYVNNTKYGKDATKFIAIQNINPLSQCICVSSSGFTPDVIERAKAARILALTYEQLFSMFEKFSPFVDHILDNTALALFDSSYEEPNLVDHKGTDSATAWLTAWRDSDDVQSKWLIVLGEYGTGKTSLTEVLQYRWTQDYRNNPSSPIPFRIELKSFSRQFDGRTLLHHFLDTNNLGHIPIDFVYHLMRSGRIVLLLDGYDEMAQFLSPRERRACLGTLADLAGQGAKGILTSRPNYFTETEELRVFETLYATLDHHKYYIGASDKEYLKDEQNVDSLITRYLLDRYERDLSDLDESQTEALVRRKLKGDPSGQELILALLKRVFREDLGRNKIALSGKPVIIAYLLELVDDLRNTSTEGPLELTEWDVYKMIVDRLMLRDQRRSPLDPQRRRKALQRLAVALSGRDARSASEQVLRDVIESEFRHDFRLMSPDDKRHRLDELFEDIRGSATLTRGEGDTNTWTFSHNSLREYLSTEHWLSTLLSGHPAVIGVPISTPMRTFAAAAPSALGVQVADKFHEFWMQRHTRQEIGPYLTLLWEFLNSDDQIRDETLTKALSSNIPGTLSIDGVRFSSINFGCMAGDDRRIQVNASKSELSEISLADLDLSLSDFRMSTLESVSFRNANLNSSNFDGAFLFECDLSGASVKDASFLDLDSASSILVRDKDGFPRQHVGPDAVGYLQFNGAQTGPVSDIHVFQNHPRFSIVWKICERLAGQRNSQLRGLTQRGEAHEDPPFARRFMQHLSANSIVEIDGRELVTLTAHGRNIVGDFLSLKVVSFPTVLRNFLEEN
jgi:hypothetical protein